MGESVLQWEEKVKRNSILNALAIFATSSGLFFYSSRNSPAASNDQAVLQADRALTAALGKPDAKSVSELLDSSFAWTGTGGKTSSKSETLQDLSDFASDNRDDAGAKALAYSQLGLVFGTHHDVRFVRIWVKSPKGWKLFVDLDTPTAAEARPAGLTRGGAESTGDCDNPCRTLPYKPTTAADQAVLAEWQKTKMDEWHPDADDWATHIADEFMIINNGSARDKPDRVALAKKQQAAGIGAPGAPILSMNMYDYGDAVVMISHHFPYQGGKPYYNVRVFVNRDGHWPLVWSQQTTIQSAAAVAPVNEKK
jgi:hypothetical protein